MLVVKWPERLPTGQGGQVWILSSPKIFLLPIFWTAFLLSGLIIEPNSRDKYSLLEVLALTCLVKLLFFSCLDYLFLIGGSPAHNLRLSKTSNANAFQGFKANSSLRTNWFFANSSVFLVEADLISADHLVSSHMPARVIGCFIFIISTDGEVNQSFFI